MAEPAYVAAEDLFIARVRAHRAGDRVPAANVRRNGWDDKVREVRRSSPVEVRRSAPVEVPAATDPE